MGSQIHCHDKDFYPDIVLRATNKTLSPLGLERPSVVINGTSPGPALRIKGGRTTWIRVYNDMSEQNLTVVIKILDLLSSVNTYES
jgi:L-ascorbate oxidase